LAYAHDAGMAHHDVQLHSLLVNEQGQARWVALGVASETVFNSTPVKGHEAARRANTADLQQVHQQRHQAERDVIGCGLLMYRWLASHPAFDEADFGAAMNRLAPLGHEILRLPFGSTQEVPEALRAIVNRCTANQERQRYRSARTLLRALDGWRQAQAIESGGPLSLLMDRINQGGHLPAQPGLAARVAAMTSTEGQHVEGMASQVLLDIALCLELLRASNSGQLREATGSSDGPILAIRRSIALLGVDGVRRAANSLRLWPGPLQPAQAGLMQQLIDRVRLAAYAAQVLRPAGYDPEVMFLVVVMQYLGRLLVQYHFPDEAEQIEQLMRPTLASAGADGAAAELPGLSEEGASNTVLGVDFDTLRSAVVRQWGLGEDLVQMIRPLPLDKPVRTPGSDAEFLRATASAASELVAASDIQPPQRCTEALTHLASRYSRVLKVSLADLRETLVNARAAVRDGVAVAQTNSTAVTAEAVDSAEVGPGG
jgi:non-specific serine/threonine protein kinase